MCLNSTTNVLNNHQIYLVVAGLKCDKFTITIIYLYIITNATSLQRRTTLFEL